MFGKNRKYKYPSDFSLARLQWMFDEMIYRKMDIYESPTVEAVVCDDCVVILDCREDGNRITLLSRVHTLPFSLNLTPKEMEEFNGGTEGLRQRFFPIRK